MICSLFVACSCLMSGVDCRLSLMLFVVVGLVLLLLFGVGGCCCLWSVVVCCRLFIVWCRL